MMVNIMWVKQIFFDLEVVSLRYLGKSDGGVGSGRIDIGNGVKW